MRHIMLGPDGQVALPESILQQLGIQTGDVLAVSLLRGGILLTPASIDQVERMYGLAREMWAAVGGSAEFVRESEDAWRT